MFNNHATTSLTKHQTIGLQIQYLPNNHRLLTTELFFLPKTSNSIYDRIERQIKRRTINNTVVNLFFSNGLKKKYSLIFFEVLKRFYNFFLTYNTQLNKKYIYYNMFFNYSLSTSNFYHLNFLISFLSTYLTPLFALKIMTIPTKIRKRRKTEEKIQFDYIYLKPWQRFRWFVDQILTASWSNFYFSIQLRILNSLVNTLLNWRESDVSKLKLQTYSFVLSKKKM